MKLQDTGLMPTVEGLVRSTEDNLQSLLWLFALLLAVLVVICLWNMFSGKAELPSGISNLFLKVTINNPLLALPSDEVQSYSHFREVGAKAATLITSTRLEKGQRIDIDLSSLPDFPEKGVLLPALVSSIAPVRGCESFLTEIRFNRSQDPVIKSLLKYVRQRSQTSGN